MSNILRQIDMPLFHILIAKKNQNNLICIFQMNGSISCLRSLKPLCLLFGQDLSQCCYYCLDL